MRVVKLGVIARRARDERFVIGDGFPWPGLYCGIFPFGGIVFAWVVDWRCGRSRWTFGSFESDIGQSRVFYGGGFIFAK